MVDLGIIIVSFNTKDLTLTCLQTIYGKKWNISYDTVVVDNNSQDGSVDAIKKQFPKIKIVQNKTNTGFACANNQGLKQLKARYYLLLNSDTQVLEGALDGFYNTAKAEKYGVSSCKLLNNDLSIQQNAGSLPYWKNTLLWLSGLDDITKRVGLSVNSYHETDKAFYQGSQNVGWVAGTAMLIRKDVYDKIGGLDEKIFMYAEDVDYCWRAHTAGFSVGWTDAGSIIHLGGGSSHSPRYTQWRGEFCSLVYLYNKYYGATSAMLLRILIYIFVTLRIVAFAILGRFDYAKTYAKVLTTF